jgi:hypothetical protein
MEMRVKNNYEEVGQVEISFSNFEVQMLMLKSEGEGIVLTDEQEKEKYFKEENLDKLFEIINNKTVKKISYIDNDYNKIKINQFYFTLLNNEKYTVELL